MLAEHLELLLPYVGVLESKEGVREHRGFINDGMSDDERKACYEATDDHALDVCRIIRNNYRKCIEEKDAGEL